MIENLMVEASGMINTNKTKFIFGNKNFPGDDVWSKIPYYDSMTYYSSGIWKKQRCSVCVS